MAVAVTVAVTVELVVELNNWTVVEDQENRKIVVVQVPAVLEEEE